MLWTPRSKRRLRKQAQMLRPYATAELMLKELPRQVAAGPMAQKRRPCAAAGRMPKTVLWTPSLKRSLRKQAVMLRPCAAAELMLQELPRQAAAGPMAQKRRPCAAAGRMPKTVLWTLSLKRSLRKQAVMLRPCAAAELMLQELPRRAAAGPMAQQGRLCAAAGLMPPAANHRLHHRPRLCKSRRHSWRRSERRPSRARARRSSLRKRPPCLTMQNPH
jgi:hypothetical protein